MDLVSELSKALSKNDFIVFIMDESHYINYKNSEDFTTQSLVFKCNFCKIFIKQQFNHR